MTREQKVAALSALPDRGWSTAIAAVSAALQDAGVPADAAWEFGAWLVRGRTMEWLADRSPGAFRTPER